MKKYILVLLFAISHLLINAQDMKTYFATDNPIIFDNSEFYLGWSANPRSGYYVHEYFVDGEFPESYNRMFTINLLEGNITPKVAAELKANELDKRKQSDKICNYMTLNKGDEYVVDFLVSDAGDGNFTTVEWDIHYYKTVNINGKSYLQLLFFSQRAYGNDMIPFLKSIPEHRADKIEELTGMSIQVKKVFE